MSLSTRNQRNLYYASDLTLNEMNEKLARQVAKREIEELRPTFESLAKARSKRRQSQLLQQVDRTAERQRSRFKRDIKDKVGNFVYRALEEKNKLITDQPLRARKTTKEQREATEKKNVIKPDARTRGQTAKSVDRKLLARVKQQAMRTFDSPEELDSALNTLLANKQTVRNTELDHVTRRAKEQANREVSDEYMYLTVGDDRVTDICSPHHGKIYKYSDKNAPIPPLHYNCRCTIEPVTSATRDSNELLRRPADVDRWFNSNRDKIIEETLDHNPLDHLVKGRKISEASMRRGKRVFRNNKEAIPAVLNSLKKNGVWPSKASYMTTANTFNDRQARAALTRRASLFGVDLKLPKPMSRKPSSRQISQDTAEDIYD